MAYTQKTKQQIMAERAAAAKRKPEPLKPKVRKTQAQIDAELAAAKKAVRAMATLPSKEKRAEMINAQQARINRSKTVAPKPAVKRAAVKPAPMGTSAPKPSSRITPMPKTTKKAPATAPKKQQKMTPQDEAMKKILEKKYGKIYG